MLYTTRSLPRITLIIFFTLASPPVLAHAGHGNEFKGQNTDINTPTPVKVDPKTAQSLGIKIEAVSKKQLDIRLRATGQIEILPNKKVELTAPIPGRIVKLLVEPNSSVKAGQIVAVLVSGELVALRVEAAQKRAEALSSLKQAQADLELAQENLARQQKIASAEINRTQTEVSVAKEIYERDKNLAEEGALTQRNLLESKAHLETGKAELAKALNQQEVIKAENGIRRATASLEAAKTQLQISDLNYKTRLQQIGTIADSKGLVVVRSPINGKVLDREATLGQAFQDTGGKLMTIVNDDKVFVTANIYEKDLKAVKLGQRVKVKVVSISNRIFTGTISQIDSAVQGDKRVVLVKAELDNFNKQLKSGLFAELEIITDKNFTPVLAIPTTAVVEANNKKIVYLQNGDALQATEVELGKTSGDLVEVKTGLFEGDLIVTQRALQLYAQSLRGDSKHYQAEEEQKTPLKTTKISADKTYLWVLISGIVLATVSTISFRLGRSNPRKNKTEVDSEESKEVNFSTVTQPVEDTDSLKHKH
ncbi:MAG: efflux RND transporter periplasmic adaptor subunit [Cyanobacteriota bacterium ELA615]